MPQMDALGERAAHCVTVSEESGRTELQQPLPATRRAAAPPPP